MNYYSIEYFKHYLKEINSYIKRTEKLKLSDTARMNYISNRVNQMIGYVEAREESNKSAYSKKWMKKPIFE
jgi:hypothetical protein